MHPSKPTGHAAQSGNPNVSCGLGPMTLCQLRRTGHSERVILMQGGGGAEARASLCGGNVGVLWTAYSILLWTETALKIKSIIFLKG